MTEIATQLPEIDTHYRGPLLAMEASFLAHQKEIEAWFRQSWIKTPPPFYASVDLRNAGYKLAPVDTNLFPAGFNNLNPAFTPMCVQALQAAFEHVCPMARGALLIPERHTRNLFYLESVAALAELFELAGFDVRVGSLDAAPGEIDRRILPSGRELSLHPIERHGDRLMADGFSPCAIVLNNDLSGGIPPILDNIEQTIIPPMALGWWNRRKSVHFSHYQDITHEFAERIGIDSWLLNPLFADCGEIDFLKREGEDCLAEQVERLLTQIAEKYAEHGIDQEPFVVVKADSGTYGMGVMTARSAADVIGLNRKQRTRMTASKEGLSISRVIIQEGVHSFETMSRDHHVAEPVIYMIDRYVIGGFYRVHTERDVDENLNTPGAHFVPMSFAESCVTPNATMGPDACPNRLYAYGVVARLALLAAAREVADVTATGRIA